MHARIFGSSLRSLIPGFLVVVVMSVGLIAGPAEAAGGTCASESVTVTQMHKADRPFYVSTTESLMSGAVGWTFSGAQVTDAGRNLWVKVDNFSSPSTLSLNSNQPAAFPVVGRSLNGGNPVAYAYLTATAASA